MDSTAVTPLSFDVPFKPPSLRYVARGDKLRDARRASSPRYSAIRAGDVFWCADGVSRVLVRVKAVERFEAGFGEAWAFHGDSLLPPSWAVESGFRVNDVQSAQAFYDTLVPRSYRDSAGASAVVVFELEVLSHNMTPSMLEVPLWVRDGLVASVAPLEPAPAVATPVPLPALPPLGRVAVRQLRLLEVDSLIDRELLLNPLLEHGRLLRRICQAWRSVVPRQTHSAHLLLCRRSAEGYTEVLMRRAAGARDAQAWALPSLEGSMAAPSTVVQRLSRLAEGCLDRPASVVARLRSSSCVQVVRHGYERRAQAFAVAAHGRVLAPAGEDWTWIRGRDVVSGGRFDVATSLAVGDAVHRWDAQFAARRDTAEAVRLSAYPPPNGASARRRRRSDGRGARAGTPACDHTKLGSACGTPRHLCSVLSRGTAASVRLHQSTQPLDPVAVGSAAESELVRVAVADAAAHAPPGKSGHVDETLVDGLIRSARDRARSRGSSAVSARDVAEAAQSRIRGNASRPSPAAVLPEHYDWLWYRRFRVWLLWCRAIRRREWRHRAC